eukprot:scaffold605678_cov31-Prasinocladus_malaysianus.AAC.1
MQSSKLCRPSPVSPQPRHATQKNIASTLSTDINLWDQSFAGSHCSFITFNSQDHRISTMLDFKPVPKGIHSITLSSVGPQPASAFGGQAAQPKSWQ